MNEGTRRQITLFIVLFQTMGLRFFQGIGILCLIVIIVLNLKNFSYFSHIRKPKNILGVTFLIVVVLIMKQTSLSFITNVLFMMLSSILVVLNYRKSTSIFITDLKKVLTVACTYSLISYFVIIALPSIRIFWYQTSYSYYLTIGYLFWNQGDFSHSFLRMSGLFWEAGCCCFAFNLLLLIFIHLRESKLKIVFAVLGVILTYSTAGFFCLIINFLYYLHTRKKNIVNVTLLATIFAFLAIPFLVTNFEDKLTGEHSTSGIVRQRDFVIGATLSARHPFLGVDASMEAMANNKEVNEIEDAVWLANGSTTWTNQGYMLGGYTNGLFGTLLNYGLFIGILLYIQVFKSPLINNNINKLVFYTIFLATLIGEPLSATTFFFLLALSNWTLSHSSNKIKCHK